MKRNPIAIGFEIHPVFIKFPDQLKLTGITTFIFPHAITKSQPYVAC